MNVPSLGIVMLGLSITSSWGNGHATTFRGLMRELSARGHNVLFLERDVPWYASNRDLPNPPYGKTVLYKSVKEVRERFGNEVRDADMVLIGSYVPEAVALGEWITTVARGVTAFYDIDTPVTLAKLAAGDHEYLAPFLIPRYQMYLSFTGGPTLDLIEKKYRSPMARALYCSVDPALYYPEPGVFRWDLGYIGTYSQDRQKTLERLMLTPARSNPALRMVVAGSLYPDELDWPEGVERIEHLPPFRHRAFYNAQRFTLNVTRAEMIRAGYSPSVRLFEAAACATPIITDCWEGLDTVFRVGTELLVARTPRDTIRYLNDLPDPDRRAIGERARARVLEEHTAAHRAAQLESYVLQLLAKT